MNFLDIIYDDFEANLEDFVYFRAFEVWSLSFNWLLAKPILQAEFHWKPIDGYEPGTAFEGDVHIEGPGPMTSSCRVFFLGDLCHLCRAFASGTHSPKWRFVQYRHFSRTQFDQQCLVRKTNKLSPVELQDAR